MKTDIESLIKKYESLVFEKEQLADDCDSDSEMIEVETEQPSADETIITNLKELECVSFCQYLFMFPSIRVFY